MFQTCNDSYMYRVYVHFEHERARAKRKQLQNGIDTLKRDADRLAHAIILLRGAGRFVETFHGRAMYRMFWHEYARRLRAKSNVLDRALVLFHEAWALERRLGMTFYLIEYMLQSLFDPDWFD